MRHQRHFEIDGQIAQREAMQIGRMICDLNRTVQILDLEIKAEEVRSRVHDLSNFAYPIMAKTMVARRENLKVTIAALEQRIAEIDPAQLREIATAA
jgi:hypothetical protein